MMTQWSGRNSEVKLGLAPEGWPWFTQQPLGRGFAEGPSKNSRPEVRFGGFYSRFGLESLFGDLDHVGGK